MSLLNQMLSDLEARKDDSFHSKIGIRSIKNKNTNVMSMLVLILSLTIAFAAFTAFYLVKHYATIKPKTSIINRRSEVTPPKNVASEIETTNNNADNNIMPITPLSYSNITPIIMEDIFAKPDTTPNTVEEPVKAASISVIPRIKKEPHDLYLLYHQALKLIDEKNITALNVLLDKYQNQDTPLIIEIKARLALLAGNTEKALNLMESIQPALKEYPNFYEFLASLYLQAEEWIDAEIYYKELLKESPTNGKWLLGLGIAQEGKGDIGNAIITYQYASKSYSLDNNMREEIHNKIQLLTDMDNHHAT